MGRARTEPCPCQPGLLAETAHNQPSPGSSTLPRVDASRIKHVRRTERIKRSRPASATALRSASDLTHETP
jgi:hypothetical protein